MLNRCLILVVAVNGDGVKWISVPYYENLTVDEITKEAIKFPELEIYWPHERDLDRVSRTWLCNMIHSVVGPRFKFWVQECVKDRNQKMTTDRSLNLELDPTVASWFNKSTAVSSKLTSSINLFHSNLCLTLFLVAVNGTACNLMKPGVARRRSKA